MIAHSTSIVVEPDVFGANDITCVHRKAVVDFIFEACGKPQIIFVVSAGNHIAIYFCTTHGKADVGPPVEGKMVVYGIEERKGDGKIGDANIFNGVVVPHPMVPEIGAGGEFVDQLVLIKKTQRGLNGIAVEERDSL